VNWWNSLLLWLASFFAVAVPVNVEHAKSAAAVAAARASMEAASPAPQPEPKPKPKVCPQCNNTGWITHGDGHRTRCPCGIQPAAVR